jgi:hypothetical protein
MGNAHNHNITSQKWYFIQAVGLVRTTFKCAVETPEAKSFSVRSLYGHFAFRSRL